MAWLRSLLQLGKGEDSLAAVPEQRAEWNVLWEADGCNCRVRTELLSSLAELLRCGPGRTCTRCVHDLEVVRRGRGGAGWGVARPACREDGARCITPRATATHRYACFTWRAPPRGIASSSPCGCGMHVFCTALSPQARGPSLGRPLATTWSWVRARGGAALRRLALDSPHAGVCFHP